LIADYASCSYGPFLIPYLIDTAITPLQAHIVKPHTVILILFPRHSTGISDILTQRSTETWDITAGEISRANHHYDEYEDDIEMLRGQVRHLQHQLDDQNEGHQYKKAWMHEFSCSPERPQGNNYASAAAKPAPFNPTPAATWPVAPPPRPHHVDSGRDIVMKE
jgi:hypothetical protein